VKTLPALLDTHIASGTTTLADLLKITRKDGAVYAFTSAADDVTIGGVTYIASQGLNISSLEVSAGLAVDNLELTTLDDGTTFSRIDVLSGKWRNAAFEISRYNFASPTDGVEVRMVGTIGEVHLKRGHIVAELRGLQQALQQPIGSVTSKTCRARLGDAMCTKDLATFTFPGQVSAVASSQVFSDATVITPGDPYWDSVGTLLYFNGTSGSTTFVDSSPAPQACAVSGTAVLSNAQSRFGGTSLYISASGTNSGYADTTAATHDFGVGDFTVEFSFYPAGGAYNAPFFSIANIGLAANFANTMLYIECNNSTRKLTVYGFTTGGTYVGGVATATGIYTAAAWNHVALVRASGVLYLYVNGVQRATLAWASAVNYTSTMKVAVGGWSNLALTNCYFEDVRVTKGVARYTAAFLPAVYADTWPNYPNVTTFTGFAEGYFAEGLLTFTSGPLAGLTFKIKSFSGGQTGTFFLSIPALLAPEIGNTFSVVAGCQKRLEDCRDKFNNILNFQGEPHLPGIDALTQ